MDDAEKNRLEAAGYRVGDFAEFLGLDDTERQLTELRVELGISTRQLRESKGMTQKTIARRIESTQSRVSRIEEAAPEVSLDLMFRAFFALGGKLEDLTTPSPTQPAAPEAPASTTRPKARSRPKRAANLPG